MKLKIIAKGTQQKTACKNVKVLSEVKVIDVDSGEPLKGVQNITWEANSQFPKAFVEVIIEDVDIQYNTLEDERETT